jgi:hypothetical protein
MARYELSAPDGSRYEITAPDDASEDDVHRIFSQHVGGKDSDPLTGMDFTKDINELRPEINALDPKLQDKARQKWAQHQIRKQRELAESLPGLGFAELPNPLEGLPVVGGFLDEASAGIQGGLHTISGGYVGRPYGEALALERERSRQADEASPVLAVGSKLAMGVTSAGPLARIFSSPTTVGQIGRGVAVGTPLGYVEGFSRGEGGFDNRNDSGQRAAALSAGLGAAIPIAGAGAQRAFGAYADHVQPGITRMRSGPAAAADEILANKIYREGSSPQAKRLQLQQGQNAARMDSNSRVDLPEMLADTSDSMRRLAGSAYRSGGEAGNTIKTALDGRQRGSDNPYTLAAPTAAATPSGQRGRIYDGVRRSLLVRSQNGARTTERQIIRDQQQTGRKLYQQAYQNDDAFNLDAPLSAMGMNINEHTGAHRNSLQRALDLFVQRGVPGQPYVQTVRRFDAAKKQLDDMIETAGRGGERNLQRQLIEFKDSLLERVHEGGRNPVYQQAREAWGSAAERRDAIELGRNALRDDSDVTLEAFNELSSGNQALFRVGVVEGARRMMSSKRPGDDLTRIFQQFRVQELMNGIIPRSQRSTATFANRAQRFGEVQGREAGMVQTRNKVLGNSETATRVQDDAEFTGQAMRGMWDRFRNSPGIINMGFEAIGYGLQRVFGYRQDVALELARRLITTDRETQNRILRRLIARGGPDRFTQFAQQVDEISRALQTSVPASLGSGGSVRIGDGRGV